MKFNFNSGTNSHAKRVFVANKLPNTMCDQAETIVVLVHGTWGQTTPFAFAQSVFCQRIQDNVHFPLRFLRFEWSGVNSHDERLAAAINLSAFLQQLMTEAPRARICLIGHSHGGNVIAYAMRSEEIASRIADVFTIATPFIDVRLRRWAASSTEDVGQGWVLVNIFPLLMFLVGVLPILLVGYFVIEKGFGALEAFLMSFGIDAVLIGILVSISYGSKTPVDETFRSRAESLVAKLSIGKGLSDKVFIICVGGDEAHWWLSGVVSITDLPWRGYIGCLLGCAVVGIFMIFPDFLGMKLDAQLVIAALAVAITFSLSPIPLILTLVIGLGQAIFRGDFGFGSESLLSVCSVRVKSKIRPAHCRIRDELYLKIEAGGRLRHSKILEDDRVITFIADKIDNG